MTTRKRTSSSASRRRPSPASANNDVPNSSSAPARSRTRSRARSASTCGGDRRARGSFQGVRLRFESGRVVDASPIAAEALLKLLRHRRGSTNVGDRDQTNFQSQRRPSGPARRQDQRHRRRGFQAAAVRGPAADDPLSTGPGLTYRLGGQLEVDGCVMQEEGDDGRRLIQTRRTARNRSMKGRGESSRRFPDELNDEAEMRKHPYRSGLRTIAPTCPIFTWAAPKFSLTSPRSASSPTCISAFPPRFPCASL